MLRHIQLARALPMVLLAIALAVCNSPLQAQDYAATVIEQVGMVSAMESGFLRAISAGNTVKPRQMIVTGPDGYARFRVSDGTTFEVFQNSRVMFRENLGDWRHLLNVWIGRIKVFVQHAPGVPNPNNVSSPTALVSVRGTVFDVVVQDDDGTTFVTVDEGQVAVRNMTAPGNSAILNPGDSITVFRGQPLFARQIDNGNVLRKILQATRDAIWQLPAQRGGPAGAPGPATPPAQGDKDKPGTSTGTGTPPGPTGTPPPPGGGN